MRNKVVRALVAFVVAAIIGYVVATLFSTAANLIRLSAVGAQISFGDAVRTFFFDLRRMAPALDWTKYGSLIIISFAIAFPVAAVLKRLTLRAEGGIRRIAPILY